MKKYAIAIFVILVIAFAVIIAFQAAPEKKTDVNIPQDKILYFYSETCPHCIRQKPIVQELETEGVKFQWMNVGEHQEYLSQYGVEGTPTFIFKNKNTRLVGEQTKEQLKKFWEDNK